MAESPLKMQECLWEEELFQGKDCLRTRDYLRAEAWLRASATRARNYFGKNDPRTALTIFHQARLCYVLDKFEQGYALDQEAWSMRREALGPDSPEACESCCCLALFGPSPPRLEGQEQIAIHQRALNYALEHFGEASWQAFRVRGQLWALHYQISAEAAEGWLIQLRAAARALERQPDIPDEWGRLGDSACVLQAWAQTAEFYSHSLSHREAHYGKESAPVARTLAGVAQAYLLCGQTAIGKATLERAQALADKLGLNQKADADEEWTYSEPPDIDPFLGFGMEGQDA